MIRDETDITLLRLLQEDGRATWKELAEATGLSPSTVLERVRRLERSGIIRGFSAQINAPAAGLPVEALVAVTMEPHSGRGVESFMEALKQWPSVVEAWHLTGQADFVLRVAVTDLNALEKVLTDEICSLPHIRNVQTSIVLSVSKEPSPLPVPPPQRK